MVKAIQTHYANCHFRSRLEARWAVFFNCLGVRWEYEKEGFKLPSGHYLPDFWLPNLGCWLEVKPDNPDDQAKKLCEELGWETDRAVVLLSGSPGSEKLSAFCFDCKDSSAGTGWWGDRDGLTWALTDDGELCFRVSVGPDRYFASPNCQNEFAGMLSCTLSHEGLPLIQAAYRRALSARFERGEKPDDQRITVLCGGGNCSGIGVKHISYCFEPKTDEPIYDALVGSCIHCHRRFNP